MPHPSVFVNIPTTDLDRSKLFFEALGYTINPLFTDDNAACVVISDTIYLMVLTRDFFATFTEKEIVDPTKAAQTQVALTCESREAVDEMMAKGLAAGGSEPVPAQDHGFMYSRDLEDPDGNNFAYLFMEPTAADQGPEAYLAEQAGNDKN